MRDEMRMYVVEEGVDIGVERGIEDMRVVVAKRFKLLKIPIHTRSVDLSTTSIWLGPLCSIYI